MIKRVVDSGSVSPMELESIVGRLSFTQTSVFGRVGRWMMAPRYAKLRDFPYRQALSQKESTALRWRTVAIGHMKPRVATPKPKLTERAVYTDTVGKAQITDALIIGPSTFDGNKTIKRVCATRTGPGNASGACNPDGCRR